MTHDKLIGFSLGLIGAIFCWQSGISVALFFQAGGAAHLLMLLIDPDLALRTLTAMAAFLAGLAALTERRGGSWLAGLAMCIYFVQTMAMMSGQGEIESWYVEGVTLSILTALFLTLTVSRNTNLVQMNEQAEAA